jgi:RsiW-degrading membrane proteinase PrsW (M82 family)
VIECLFNLLGYGFIEEVGKTLFRVMIWLNSFMKPYKLSKLSKVYMLRLSSLPFIHYIHDSK